MENGFQAIQSSCKILSLLILSLTLTTCLESQNNNKNQQLLDEITERKLLELIKHLDAQDYSVRNQAQEELEDFLDNDAKAKFVKKITERGDPDLRERGARVLYLYKAKKFGRIVFIKNCGVFVIDPDGENLEQVIEPQAIKADMAEKVRHLAWSPDGRKIVYVSMFGDPEIHATSAVYIVNLEKDDKKLLADEIRWDAFYYSVAWSPDGSKIAIHAHRKDKLGIYLMDTDGENLSPLAEDQNYYYGSPCWSPDGRKIAFLLDQRDINGYQLYSIDIGGKHLTRLTSSREKYDCPAYSPDGREIAFVANMKELRVMDANGENQKQISKGLEYYKSPTWSPDGKRIAFSAMDPRSRNYGIYVIDRNGENLQFLTEGDYPSWGGYSSKRTAQKK